MAGMNSIVNSCIKCGEALKWIPVLFIVTVLAWSYYAYVIQLCFCKYLHFVEFFFKRLIYSIFISFSVFVQNMVQQGKPTVYSHAKLWWWFRFSLYLQCFISWYSMSSWLCSYGLTGKLYSCQSAQSPNRYRSFWSSLLAVLNVCH